MTQTMVNTVGEGKRKTAGLPGINNQAQSSSRPARFGRYFCRLVLGISIISWLPAVSAHDTPGRMPAISVSGTGSVDAAPDMAIITMTVRREAKTAREALDQNNLAMGDVLQAMKSQGIAARDLQTSGFSINPKITYPKSSAGNRNPQLVGYIVLNTITARIRNLASLGTVLDKSVTLGVNQGGQIQFTNDKPESLIASARSQAMASAIAKATTLVKAAGVSLGNIMEISEHSSAPRPMPMARGAVMAAMKSEESVPVQAGENTYSVTVNVSWLIKQ
ncbi:MAG: SIMPL domain-containing protein [Burkholderiaceae bacterium]